MKSFSIDYDGPDAPLNEYFAMNDFGSKLVVKNLGSTLYFVFAYLCAWILFFIMKLGSMFCRK